MNKNYKNCKICNETKKKEEFPKERRICICCYRKMKQQYYKDVIKPERYSYVPNGNKRGRPRKSKKIEEKVEQKIEQKVEQKVEPKIKKISVASKGS